MKRILVVLALLSLPQAASAHKVGDVDYTNWTRPGGGSCCGGADCAPVRPGDVRKEADGSYSVFRYGVWTNFPPDRVMAFPSPDAQVHACMAIPIYEGKHFPYCIALPGGS